MTEPGSRGLSTQRELFLTVGRTPGPCWSPDQSARAVGKDGNLEGRTGPGQGHASIGRLHQDHAGPDWSGLVRGPVRRGRLLSHLQPFSGPIILMSRANGRRRPDAGGCAGGG